MRIITLNLNGIRSACNKGFLPWLANSGGDIVCLQELKAQVSDMQTDMLQPPGYHGYFHYAEKKGYSGVGIYSKQPADKVIIGLGHAEIDAEGRYLECQYGNLSVVSLYLPSGSSGEERQQFKFAVMAKFLPHLEQLIACGREVVICGDWNIAHQEIDLKNFKGNRKNSGFLPEERAWMTDVLGRVGWVDTYRGLYPDTTDDCYTWWSNRGQAWAKNVGWRIDHFLVSESILDKVKDAMIYNEFLGSDHCPVELILE